MPISTRTPRLKINHHIGMPLLNLEFKFPDSASSISSLPTSGANSYAAPANATPEIALESTFQALALITTFLRLWYRIHVGRFWWDDTCALLALIFSIPPYVLFVISMVKPFMLMDPLPLFAFSRLGSLTFYTAALWSAKASLAVTLVRLGTRTFASVSKIATVLIGLCGLALILQKIFICGTDLREIPTCPVPKYTGILELTLDLLGDVWLIGAPFYMLYKIKLARQHHRLISLIFGSGIVATIASIMHGYYTITANVILMVVVGQIQVSLSIVTCNLLVLVTYVYRRVHQDEGTIDRTEDTDPSSNGMGILATESPQTVRTPTGTNITSHYTFTDIETDSQSAGYYTSATDSSLSQGTQATQPSETSSNS